MSWIVLKGKVKIGRQVGRRLGFATINIPASRLKVKKSDWGVYLSLVRLDDKIYPGVTHLGPARTFNLLRPTCETHLLTLKKDLYGQKAEKRLLVKIREVKQFDNLAKLKNQIKKDVKMARKYFGL